MRRFFALGHLRVAVIVLFLFLSPVQSSVVVAKDLVVGVEKLTYFPHYSYDDEFGHRGVYKEILNVFGQRYNYQFQYIALPIERLYLSLFDGAIDLKYPDNAEWKADIKRGHTISYSKPVVTYVDGVMVLPENIGKGIEHVHSLGVPLGFTPVGYQELIKQDKLLLTTTNSFGSLLQLVMMGRLDGAYINIAVGKYQLQTQFAKPKALVFDDSLPHVSDGYRLSTLSYPKVIEQFNQFLVDERQLIEQLKERFGVH